MPIDYLAADGETYSGSLVFTFLVQALEDSEDAVEVLLVKPDAVIRPPGSGRVAGPDALSSMDSGRRASSF